MSRRFNRVDRDLVELAIDLIASGEDPQYALSRAAQRLRDQGRKGVRFSHVLALESDLLERPAPGADARIASLQLLLATEGA